VQLDICDKQPVDEVIRLTQPDIVIHAASPNAQKRRKKYNIPTEMVTETDPTLELMAAADESALRQLKPDYSWGSP